MKGEIYNSMIIVGVLNVPLSTRERSFREKIQKETLDFKHTLETLDFKYTLEEMGITDRNKIFQPMTEYIVFPSTQRIFPG